MFKATSLDEKTFGHLKRAIEEQQVNKKALYCKTKNMESCQNEGRKKNR